MIYVDYSDVPDEIQRGKEFRPFLDRFRLACADYDQAVAACLHEIVHAHFLALAGAKDITITGPEISYDREKSKLVALMAQVKFTSQDHELIEQIGFTVWFSAMVIAHRAGGVVVEEMTKIPNNGDEQDRELFCDFLNSVKEKGGPDFTHKETALWNEARTKVQEYLQNQDLRIAFQEGAELLRPTLFKESESNT